MDLLPHEVQTLCFAAGLWLFAGLCAAVLFGLIHPREGDDDASLDHACQLEGDAPLDSLESQVSSLLEGVDQRCLELETKAGIRNVRTLVFIDESALRGFYGTPN